MKKYEPERSNSVHLRKVHLRKVHLRKVHCLLLFFLTIACSHQKNKEVVLEVPDWEYALVVAVDARQLNYSDIPSFIQSVQNTQDRGIGHAWVILKGHFDQQPISITGGHTGEFGEHSPRYLDQFAYLIGRNDPDPVRVLFQLRHDGMFEEGSGGHTPTLAVAFPLTQERFNSVYALFQEGGYDFSSYNILNHQCVHFAATCLAVAGYPVEVTSSHTIPKKTSLFGKEVQLWDRPEHQILEIATPEALERALIDQVNNGIAVVASSDSAVYLFHTYTMKDVSHAQN